MLARFRHLVGSVINEAEVLLIDIVEGLSLSSLLDEFHEFLDFPENSNEVPAIEGDLFFSAESSQQRIQTYKLAVCGFFLHALFKFLLKVI